MIERIRRDEAMVRDAMTTLYATLTADEAATVLNRLADLSPGEDPDRVPVAVAVAFLTRETAHVVAWRGRE